MRLLHEHIGVRLGSNYQPVMIRRWLSLYRVQTVEAQWIYTGKWWRIPVISCASQLCSPCYGQSCYRQPCFGQSCYRQSCYERPSYYRLSCILLNATSHDGASRNDRSVRMEIFREGASWVLSRVLDEAGVGASDSRDLAPRLPEADGRSKLVEAEVR